MASPQLHPLTGAHRFAAALPALDAHQPLESPRIMEKTLPTSTLTREAAAALVAAARDAARSMGVEVSVAVTDAGAHLRAFERTDASGFLTVDIAVVKAWTAASFGLPTQAWPAILANPNAAQLAQRPRFVAVGGGVPVFSGRALVGAIGISGGDYLQDQRIAEAALAAVGFSAAPAA
jgi:uncharacterized protein GlcG (DUF336 family)